MVKTCILENIEDLYRCERDGVNIIATCENRDGSITLIYEED